MAKIFYGINNTGHHESWLKLSRVQNPQALLFGVKDAKGNAPTFAKMHREELHALRDTLDDWLRSTTLASVQGDL